MGGREGLDWQWIRADAMVMCILEGPSMVILSGATRVKKIERKDEYARR